METRRSEFAQPSYSTKAASGEHKSRFWAISLAMLIALLLAVPPVHAGGGKNLWGGREGGHLGRPPIPPPRPPRPPQHPEDGNLGLGIIRVIPQIIHSIPSNQGDPYADDYDDDDDGDYEYDGTYQYGNTYQYNQQVTTMPVTPQPQVTPLANKVVEKPVDVKPNRAPLSRMQAASYSLTQDLKDQLENKTEKHIAGIQDILDDRQPPVDTLANQLGAGKPGGYSANDKKKILDQAKNGDYAAVKNATAGDSSAEAEGLRSYAKAQQALNDVHDAVLDGTLTQTQWANLQQAASNGGFVTQGNYDEFHDRCSKLIVISQMANIVNNAQPNGTVGPVSTIVLVGSMGNSQAIYLGNGTALVGTQGATSGLVIAQGTTAQALGMAAGSGDPVSDYDGNPIPGGTYVINRGPTDVYFVVDGNRYTVGPNLMRTFVPAAGSKIEFYRRGDSDLKSYKLEEGTYDFRYADGIWDLYRQNYSVTLSNADNAMDFQYVVNNQQQSLAPGSKQQHSSKYPLVFRFDNGRGQVEQKRLIQGEYRVAVTDDGTLDLFSAADVVAPLAVDELAASSQVVNLFGDSDTQPRRSTTTTHRRKDASDIAPKLFD
jgi:hypothetical protein